jgi:photosystem II stability/assembly factor-like uncharacterized protein
MQIRWFSLFAGIILAFQAGAAQHQTLNDPQLAHKVGITVQQLHSLRAASGLSDDQILALTTLQLQAYLQDITGHPGVDKHAAQQNFTALRMMDEHGQVPPDGLLRAIEHRRHGTQAADLLPGVLDPSTNSPSFGIPGPMLAGIQTNGWTWLGPGNIGGRVRSILIHPVQTNILWCGGVDGGIWKSTNSGAAWFPLDDFMANLAVGSMAMDPADPNTIYAGTGEATYNADGIRGAGIFKTINGGATWVRLPSTTAVAFQYVARIAIDPNNSQSLLAATRGGIYRSLDGGTNWAQRTAATTFDVQFHPTDSSQAVASGNTGTAWYSIDGGFSWASATGVPASGRIEVTYARSSPNCVYASCENASGQIYRSVDGGHTYTLINSGNAYLGSQGWYDDVIWVDPTTTNLVVVGGGPDLWRSTDGGATLTKISQWQSAPTSAHADHHAIVASPAYNGTTIKTVYFGNDGGVYRAADVSTVSLVSGWQSLNNNLGITQFYGGAGNTNSNVIVGGTQDNGTLRYSGNPQGWTAMFGGDGGFCAADPTDPNYFYGEYVYLQIHRSANGGLSSSYITTGLTDAGSSANFIAPFILDPNNANTMLGGGASLWRSANVKAATPSWAAIKPSIGSSISAIAVASGNSDIIWVGHNNGNVYRTANGTTVSPTWTQVDLGTPNLPNRYCERIAISPVNPSKVYVTFGGFNPDNVWRTTDNGVTWANISGNLPPAPVNSIVISPTDPLTLYVGTEVGVYGTPNDGVNWSTGNDGPANVSIDELFWMGPKLIAVTHGRGMYSITPALGGANPVATGSLVLGGNGNGAIDPNECNQLKLAIQNVGGVPATNITARLSTTTPGVTVVQAISTYADLAPTAVGTNTVLFQLSTSPSFTCGAAVTVALEVAFNGTTNVLPFILPASSGSGYTLTTTTGATIVPGVADTGNHADDGTTSITLPFTFTFYGQSFNNAALCSNGSLQFQSNDAAYNNSCLPYSGFSYAIVPFWDDLLTSSAGSGIFTSISGSAPNRIANIEWRATYFSGGASLNFEVRLYEGQARFDMIYGTLNGDGSTATVGVQKDSTTFMSYECNAGASLSPGLQLTYQQTTCPDGGGACATAPLLFLPTQYPPQFIFSFLSSAGQTYQIQSSGTLNGLDWQPLGNVIGDGTVKNVTNTMGNTNLYYRLLLQ